MKVQKIVCGTTHEMVTVCQTLWIVGLKFKAERDGNNWVIEILLKVQKIVCGTTHEMVTVCQTLWIVGLEFKAERDGDNWIIAIL